MSNPRRGRGGHAYRRRAEALKRRTKANGGTCSNCGEPFDWDNHISPRGFTADHPDPLKLAARSSDFHGGASTPSCGPVTTHSADHRPAIHPAARVATSIVR